MSDNETFNLNDLKTDKVLVYYDGPLLFVCKNHFGQYYIAYCCDVDLKEYVLAATTIRSLIDLLENRITMFCIFQESNEKWKVENSCARKIDGTFDELDLPEKEAFLDELSEPFVDYLTDLRKIESPRLSVARWLGSFCLITQSVDYVADSIFPNLEWPKKSVSSFQGCKRTYVSQNMEVEFCPT
ncbi:MAG: hypothetical protein J6P84_00070 [Alphaproteobacteria bacterium]|nr:hypothetical protein [Alphaproteobacteria bacterium]MBO7551620.1 hypothetical protein [Fibrobacter sp.]